MKILKVDLPLDTALENLAMLTVILEVGDKSMDTPEDVLRIETIRKLQFQINTAIMKQATAEEIDEAISTNIERFSHEER